MKLSILLVSGLALGQASAAVITETYGLSTSVVIPDADLSGVVQTITVGSTALETLDSVTVTLSTTGGWNGDLYAYLWHDGVISVLVNRPGRSAALPDGSPTAGLTLTLADAAASDLHLASGALNGTFQPDQRATHPSLTLATDPRTTPLSLFAATAPAGTWRLFIADVAGGEEATLLSWSISLTGPEAVPEPGTWTLLAVASLAVAARRRRERGCGLKS